MAASRPDPPDPDPPAALLTAGQVGRLIGKSQRSVRRDSAAGRLPRPVRVGGAVRWRKAEILRWIAAGCPPQ